MGVLGIIRRGIRGIGELRNIVWIDIDNLFNVRALDSVNRVYDGAREIIRDLISLRVLLDIISLIISIVLGGVINSIVSLVVSLVIYKVVLSYLDRYKSIRGLTLVLVKIAIVVGIVMSVSNIIAMVVSILVVPSIRAFIGFIMCVAYILNEMALLGVACTIRV